MPVNELFLTTLYTDANLLYYYRLEGNSNASVGAVNGTDTSITYSSGNGKFDQGAGFNGSTSKIALNGSTVAAGNTWTVMGWFKTTQVTGGCMWSNGDSASDNAYARISIGEAGAGKIFAEFRDDGGSTLGSITSSGTYHDGNWHHFAFKRIAANSWKVFIDGVSVGTNTASLSTMTINRASLGCLTRTGDVIFYNGSLDDVSIFNRVLTDTEISDYYDGLTPLLPSNGGAFLYNFV